MKPKHTRKRVRNYEKLSSKKRNRKKSYSKKRYSKKIKSIPLILNLRIILIFLLRKILNQI